MGRRNSGGGGSGAGMNDVSLAEPQHLVLPVPEVEERLKRDGMDKYLYLPHDGSAAVAASCGDVEHDFDEKRIVYYLYGREFLWVEGSVAERVSWIESFLEAGAKQRLLHVLSYQPDRARNPDRSWKSAQAMALRYGAPENSFTIFQDRTIPLVLKLQASTTCFLAATTTALGYRAGSHHGAGAGNAGGGAVIGTSLDAAQYVRHRMSNDMLEQLVVKNEGGSSLGVLTDVVGDSNIVCVAFNKASRPGRPPLERSSQDLLTNLRDYGAGLVSNFDVSSLVSLWTDYRQSGGVQRGEEASHLVTLDRVVEAGETLNVLTTRNLGETTQDELKYIISVAQANQGLEDGGAYGDEDAKRKAKRTKTAKGSRAGQVERRSIQNVEDESMEHPMYHAMVLVGYRCETVTADDGSDATTFWFLLQNSWETLPLLEVSASFYARFHAPKAQGMTHFVVDLRDSDDRNLLHGVKFECNIDDGGDGPRDVPLEDRKRSA
jgi:hypothetical protein